MPVRARPRVPWPRAACVPALLALAVAAPGAQEGTRFRSGTDAVHIGVTVTDRRGRLVEGLTRDDFAVLEDGVPQPLAYFSAGGRAVDAHELHLAVLLDVSESMGEALGFTRTAAIRFLNTLEDAVDITVVDFDTEVRLGRFSQREFPRVVERIRRPAAGGHTALYDAVAVYLAAAAEQGGRKVMLLYTDGGDTRSETGLAELLDGLKASDVTIYAVGMLDRQPQSARMMQRRILQQIAGATGGRAVFPDSVRALEDVYGQIVAEIRAQYLLGYHPAEGHAGPEWRALEVTVVGPGGRDYRVRARRGYYR